MISVNSKQCRYMYIHRTVLKAPYVVLDVDNLVSRHVCVYTHLMLSTLYISLLSNLQQMYVGSC